MKKNLNVQKAGVLIIIALAMIFITGQFFSILQEPPHINHLYIHPTTVSAPYYDTNDWYPSNINIIKPTFTENINWSNVYKVGVSVTASVGGDNGNVGYILNPQCTTKATQYGTDYTCSGSSATLGYVQDGVISSFSKSITFNKLLNDVGFISSIDRGKSARLSEVVITVSEQVECTQDSHCVSAAPICNTVVNKCEAPVQITEPPVVEPTGLNSFLSEFLDWLKGLFSGMFLSITGEQNVAPNTQHIYNIDISTTAPDHDYSDGSYQTQYAYWALLKNDGTIIKGQTTGVEVNGSYKLNVTITTPLAIEDYALVSTITQIDSIYNLETNTWEHGEETIMVKEALDIQTKISAIDKPIATGFGNLIDAFISWIKGLFGL